MKPNLALVIVAALALVLGTGCGAADDEGAGPGAGPTTTAEETVTAPVETLGVPVPGEWTVCRNEVEGYSVEYPTLWHTASLGPRSECAFFDPGPFEIVEGSEFPATALEAHWAAERDRSFDQVLKDLTGPMFERTLLRKEATAGGLPAVLLETEATGEGLFEKGTRSYEYLINREGRAFIVKTTSPGADGDYEVAKAVVDRAVSTVRFFAPEQAAARLPPAVDKTRDAIATAAAAGDYDALAELIPDTGFEYTYGGPVPGGPTAFWKQVEAESAESPLETLALLLEMDYTKVDDIYVWPFAYDRDPKTLTPAEREVLSAIANEEQIEQWTEFGHYLGWRAGIESDGTWIFYVAGD